MLKFLNTISWNKVINKKDKFYHGSLVKDRTVYTSKK